MSSTKQLMVHSAQQTGAAKIGNNLHKLFWVLLSDSRSLLCSLKTPGDSPRDCSKSWLLLLSKGGQAGICIWETPAIPHLEVLLSPDYCQPPIQWVLEIWIDARSSACWSEAAQRQSTFCRRLHRRGPEICSATVVTHYKTWSPVSTAAEDQDPCLRQSLGAPYRSDQGPVLSNTSSDGNLIQFNRDPS